MKKTTAFNKDEYTKLFSTVLPKLSRRDQKQVTDLNKKAENLEQSGMTHSADRLYRQAHRILKKPREVPQ